MGGDPSNPLAIMAGYDAGTTADQVCEDPEGHGLNLIRRVLFTPSGGVHLKVTGEDISLVVLALGGGPVTDPCQLVGSPIIATGTGKAKFSVLNTGKGAIVAHATVQGVVELVGGGQARVFGTARVNIKADGTLLFDEERVPLTPI
jgi:hypothetical protein